MDESLYDIYFDEFGQPYAEEQPAVMANATANRGSTSSIAGDIIALAIVGGLIYLVFPSLPTMQRGVTAGIGALASRLPK